MAPSTPPSLLSRAATTPWQPCTGCIAPHSINNQALFALFALLGLAMVAGSIWFFFYARNGGFLYHRGDWEDYKTVVMRRKGPDGQTLCGSTRAGTTRYGGASTEKGSTWNANRFAAMSVVAKDDRGRKGIMAKRGWAGTHSCTYRDDFTNYAGTQYAPTEAGDDIKKHKNKKEKKVSKKSSRPQVVPGAFEVDIEMQQQQGRHHASRYADRNDDDDLPAYRSERPARVGGMNRAPDGSHFSSPAHSSVSGGSSVSGSDPRQARRVLSEAEKMERRWRREARQRAAAAAEEQGAAGAGYQRQSSAPVGGRTPSPQKKRAAASGNYTFSRPGEERPSYVDAYRPRK